MGIAREKYKLQTSEFYNNFQDLFDLFLQADLGSNTLPE